MSQPVWVLQWATDSQALYIDSTGVYAPELESLKEKEGERWDVYRACLDRCKMEGGYLVPFSYDAATYPHPLPDYEEWHAKHLPDVARSCGYPDAEELRDGLCSEDATKRASSYADIAGYFGWVNFDQYPQEISTEQADGWPAWRDVTETPKEDE
jgi:hypothetical protein